MQSKNAANHSRPKHIHTEYQGCRWYNTIMCLMGFEIVASVITETCTRVLDLKAELVDTKVVIEAGT